MPDISVQVRAILTLIRNDDTIADKRGWLVSKHALAATALLNGQPRVRVLSGDGTSSELDYWTDPATMAELFQLALEEWDSEDPDAPFNPADGGVLTPRICNIPL